MSGLNGPPVVVVLEFSHTPVSDMAEVVRLAELVGAKVSLDAGGRRYQSAEPLPKDGAL